MQHKTREEEYPEEMIYADDYDNVTPDPEKKEVFKSRAKEILGRDNLVVNEDKTEETTIKRAKHDRKNKEKNEPWRDVVKLESKLGDKDTTHVHGGSPKRTRKILTAFIDDNSGRSWKSTIRTR